MQDYNTKLFYQLIFYYIILLIINNNYMIPIKNIITSCLSISDKLHELKNKSTVSFDSLSIEISSMIFVILGSLPFIAYIKFLNGNRKIFTSDVQIKSFIKIIIFSIFLLFVYSFFQDKNVSNINLRSIFFNVISILTGTGYVTGEFDGWGNFPLIFFLT